MISIRPNNPDKLLTIRLVLLNLPFKIFFHSIMNIKTALFLTFLTLILISCRMFQDTEGQNIKSKYNKDNIIFKTNSKFTYSALRIKGNDSLDCFVISFNDTVKINKVVLTILPGKFFYSI
jgi:hypothetical protein